MKKILLMTGTINPFADVSYKDPKTRYMEYQKNIKRYIKESKINLSTTDCIRRYVTR